MKGAAILLVLLVAAVVVSWVVVLLARRRPTPPAAVDPRQQRIAELTAQATADRDRCQWILTRNLLEQQAGITPEDYSDELAEISARTTILEAELDELGVLPPPSRRPDPVGPVAVEDITAIFGFPVRDGAVHVPSAKVPTVTRYLEQKRIPLAVLVTDGTTTLTECTCARHVGRGVPACPIHHYS